MTHFPAQSNASAIPAALLALVVLAMAGVAYGHLYVKSAQELERARKDYDRMAWIAGAEPKWRDGYKVALAGLRKNPPAILSDHPQEAAGWLQSQLRQALTGSGASVDSLQSTASEGSDGKLPILRAVVTARIAPEHILDILRTVEAIEPPVAVESLDIATQQAGSNEAPERVALLTLAVRAYVMPNQDDIQ